MATAPDDDRAPVLELDALVPVRRTVLIKHEGAEGGRLYAMKEPAELTVREWATFDSTAREADRMQSKMDKGKPLTQAEWDRMEELLAEQCALVLIDAGPAIAALNIDQRQALLATFWRAPVESLVAEGQSQPEATRRESSSSES